MSPEGLLRVIICLLELQNSIQKARNSIKKLPLRLLQISLQLSIHLDYPLLIDPKQIDILFNESYMHTAKPNTRMRHQK